MTPTSPENPDIYVATILSLYIDLPDTPLRASFPDQVLVRRFHARGIPCALVETALLLGSLRRCLRPADAPALARIRSLAYFQPVVEELLQAPVPDHYHDYLRLKLRRWCETLELSKR